MYRKSSLSLYICLLAIAVNNIVESFQLHTSSSSPLKTATTKKIVTARINTAATTQTHLQAEKNDKINYPQNEENNNIDRRTLFDKTSNLLKVSMATSTSMITSSPATANAATPKSRSEGYEVQYTEREWAYMLSGKQYNILREGGTERQYSSILEGEERDGQYVCAGCNTPLFESSAKFHSGTGWPSYASGLPGVEVQQVSAVQASLLGAEIRCATCGGHLGDVFNDGFIYVGTPAFETGKRFCVDGAALIFKPKDGSEDVFGDLSPPQKKNELPDFLQPPKIATRDV